MAFAGGELRIGIMPGARRARDLRQDGRIALHSQGVDPPEDDPGRWPGEAKLSGRAVETRSADGGASHTFVVDIDEAVITRVGTPADHLVIESWHPGRGLSRLERR